MNKTLKNQLTYIYMKYFLYLKSTSCPFLVGVILQLKNCMASFYMYCR